LKNSYLECNIKKWNFDANRWNFYNTINCSNFINDLKTVLSNYLYKHIPDSEWWKVYKDADPGDWYDKFILNTNLKLFLSWIDWSGDKEMPWNVNVKIIANVKYKLNWWTADWDEICNKWKSKKMKVRKSYESLNDDIA